MRRVLVVALLGLTACVHSSTEKHQPETTGNKPETTTAQNPPQNPAAPSQNPSPAATTVAPEPVPTPKPVPPMVRVTVRSVPNHSLVFWGKKKLGETPVQLDRPRDSGPVDLVVRRQGYFPFHTRAYTFRNDTVYVKLTTFADRMTIFGAKEELPPPSPGPGAATPTTTPTEVVAAPAAPSPHP